MKIRSSILALLAIAAVATGCSATAQSGPGEPGSPAEDTDVAGGELSAVGPGGRMFAEADGNKDGRVTLAEAQASALAKFTEADANKDGQVDEAEMQSMHQRRGGPGGPGQMMKHLDKNADGKISKEEAPERMRGHFDQVDANKDGQIDEAEMQAAHVQRGGPGGPGMMKHLDKNADGKLSKEEAPPPMREHFDQVDTNKDGQVDEAELRAAHEQRGGAGLIKHLDKNADGKLSKEEAPERMRGHFDEIDANKDGQIEEQELQAMRQQHGGAAHAQGQNPGGRRGGMMMKGLDANNDGKISQAEFTARIPQWFARADANGDGAVTREELQAKRPRGRRGAR